MLQQLLGALVDGGAHRAVRNGANFDGHARAPNGWQERRIVLRPVHCADLGVHKVLEVGSHLARKVVVLVETEQDAAVGGGVVEVENHVRERLRGELGAERLIDFERALLLGDALVSRRVGGALEELVVKAPVQVGRDIAAVRLDGVDIGQEAVRLEARPPDHLGLGLEVLDQVHAGPLVAMRAAHDGDAPQHRLWVGALGDQRAQRHGSLCRPARRSS
mmetsp:Transcript_13702/g.43822  ORF Transcript_13702/g.43822 Transcript_13702/m.43822 type:complete len:219 (+) Transcript_13702:795-1451(+)